MHEEIIRVLQICLDSLATYGQHPIIESQVKQLMQKLQNDKSIPVEKRVSPMLAEWVSVDDKLPEKNQQVLTYNPMDDREPFWVDYLFLAGDEKLHWDMGEDNVTHWMPLPEPPKQ